MFLWWSSTKAWCGEAANCFAGPIRNREMVSPQNNVDLVLAFTQDLGKSKGTHDMVCAANKAGIEVRIYSS